MGLIDQMMANLYKPLKQEKPSSVLPKHLTPAKVANMAAQTTVSQGQLLRGEVLDLRSNQIMVLLENGATVTARTDGTLELSIGQNAQFLVAQTTEEQILLKHVKEQDTPENPMIDKALTAANITKTERSVSIVTELLAHQQPVNEGNIRHYLSLSAKHPELPVKNLILMELHHIPVTNDNVEQFSAYQDRNGRLFHQAQELVKNLTDTLQKLPEGEIKQSFLKELTVLLERTEQPDNLPAFHGMSSKTPVSSDAAIPSKAPQTLPDTVSSNHSEPYQIIHTKESLPDMQIPPTINSLPDTQIPPTINSLPDTQVPPATNSLTDTQVLTATSDHPVSSALSAAQTDVEPEPLFRDFINSFLLKPEDVAEPKKIQDYYEKLNEKLEQLEQLSAKLSEATKEVSLETPKQMQANLSFMESINQVFPYIQLPLKFREAPAHGELYVYEKKRSLKPSDSLSALLHLEMEHLGTTDIFVTLSGNHVTTRFSMTDRESGELIQNELPSLKETLSAKGYVLQSEVTVREPDTTEPAPTLLEQFLEDHAPGGLHRYSFDIRA